MGFFSSLGELAKDIGGIAKDCAKEIKGIAKEGADEFSADPKRYIIESAKEVGTVAGTAAVKLGKLALEEGKAAGERSQKYREEMTSNSEEALLKTVKNERSSSPLKASAALQELNNRGHETKDIIDRIK